ncbi:MAG: Y4bD/Y4pK family protein [Thermoanaerobaculia bacterium]|nr:Y4bD/Y4pK family protein [Thermoanaerobaculia bacterium]
MHPFHPLCGREFALVDYRSAWGEDRVYYHRDDGELARMPASWTDIVEPDVHVVAAGGSADFRAADLLRLADIIATRCR